MARGGWTGFLRIQDDGASKTMGTIQQGFDKISKSFKTGMIQNFNSFSLMKKGIDAVVDSAKQLIKESTEVVNTSAKFSIPISQLGELRNVAIQSGLGVNGLTGALGTLHTALLDGVVNPGGEAAWTLAQMGIEQKNLIAISTRTGDAFYKIVDSLRGIKDATEREAKARAIFKGNYQDVLILAKKTQEEQDEMRRKANKYSEEQAKNNDLVNKSWADVEESVKSIAELLTPVMGMIAASVAILANSIAILFEGLKMVVGSIINFVRGALEDFVDLVVLYSNKAGNGFKRMNPWNDYTREDMERDDAVDEEAYESKKTKNFERQGALSDRTRAKIAQKLHNIQGNLSQFGSQGRQFLVNIGAADDAKSAASDEMNLLRKEEKRRKDDYTKNFQELQMARGVHELIKSKEGKDAADLYFRKTIEPLLAQSQRRQDALTKVQQEMQTVVSELKEIAPSAVWDEKQRKFVEKEPEPPAEGEVYESFQQMEVRLAQNKALREQEIKAFTAGIDSWMKWSAGAAIAYKEYQATEAALADLIAEGDKTTPEKMNAALNAKAVAWTRYNDEERKLKNLIDVAVNQDMIAAIDRKNKAIEGQQGRDIFGMKMRGVSAIDQQNVVFRNAVEKMKREQAKLDALAKDDKRSQEYMGGFGPAAQALKNSIQDLAMSAAGEMDTLMAMQFNYVSSDAAKKGMGGGIAMVNNPLDIAKESRDYLRKIYETINGTEGFNVVPEYSRGVNGWAMREGKTQLSGESIP